MKIPIKEIVFDKESYPRNKMDNDVISQYRASMDKLPPILINQNKKLVDGYHRIVAHQTEGETEIEAEIIDVPDNEIFAESIRCNSKHGKQLTSAEKRKAAIRLHSAGKNKEAIIKLLSISDRTCRNYLAETLDKERDEKKEKALELYLDYLNYSTQEKVAEALNEPQQTISRWLSNIHFGNVAKTSNPPEELQITTAWEFKLCDPNVGIRNYPGQLAGQLIENLFWYYTEPFDLVVDPMAGGGSTVDICKKMLRRYAAYDINPIAEKGIFFNDIIEGIPLGDAVADFVLLDPPYWNQKEGKYVEQKHNLAEMSLNDFYDAISEIAKESFRILKKHKKVALIISDINNKENGFVDLGVKCYQRFEEIFEPVEYISAIWRQASSHTGVWKYRAKKNKFMLRGFRHLFIMRKR